MRYTVHAVTVLALALGASPARAQNPGLPVYNMGVPRGIGLYGDVGFPNDSGGRGAPPTAPPARAGFGPFGATATLSALNPGRVRQAATFRWVARLTTSCSAVRWCPCRSRCRAA